MGGWVGSASLHVAVAPVGGWVGGLRWSCCCYSGMRAGGWVGGWVGSAATARGTFATGYNKLLVLLVLLHSHDEVAEEYFKFYFGVSPDRFELGEFAAHLRSSQLDFVMLLLRLMFIKTCVRTLLAFASVAEYTVYYIIRTGASHQDQVATLCDRSSAVSRAGRWVCGCIDA